MLWKIYLYYIPIPSLKQAFAPSKNIPQEERPEGCFQDTENFSKASLRDVALKPAFVPGKNIPKVLSS
jgi:hypothetical protein